MTKLMASIAVLSLCISVMAQENVSTIGDWEVYQQDNALVVKNVQKGVSTIGNWEVYQQDGALIVKNIQTGQQYEFHDNGEMLLIRNARPLGLVNEWKFDDQNDSTTADSAGKVNGRLSNVKRIPGLIGSGAIALTGEDNSCVSFGTDIGQFRSADFTVSFWLKTKETLGLFDVVGNRTSGSNGHFFQVRMTGQNNANAGVISVELDNNGTNYIGVSSKPGLNDDRWHHVAVTRRGVTVKLFIDGAEQASGKSDGITNIVTGDPFKIGRSYEGSGYEVPVFSFDDLKIYNGALSDKEISQLFSALSKK